jgi:hypothetical protein
VNLGISLGSRPQTLSVALFDRLDPDEPAGERPARM